MLQNNYFNRVQEVETIFENINMDIEFREKLESELELLSAEASITGMDKAEFLKMCENIYSKMNPCTM